jgi:hypothetical protein
MESECVHIARIIDYDEMKKDNPTLAAMWPDHNSFNWVRYERQHPSGMMTNGWDDEDLRIIDEDPLSTSSTSDVLFCNCSGPSKQVPLGLWGDCEVISVCTLCKKEKIP